MQDFSEKLKRTMKDKSLSQSKVADILGVDQKTISNWIRGTIVPNPEKQARIQELLGMNTFPIENFSGNDIEKIVAIRNEIQKVYDTVATSLSEIDKILRNKKI